MNLPAVMEQKLRDLVTVFLAENAKVNLSAFRTPENCWTGNVLDSLAFLEISPSTPQGGGGRGEGVKLLDLGTGGGFPLLPLAAVLPNMHLTGMDATQKKMDAVRRIADAAGLKNVELLSGRAETFGRNVKYREHFDVVTARAVAEINVLLEYASPFVKPGGMIVLWKSMSAEKELNDAKKAMAVLKCPLKKSHTYELPGNFGKRQLLVFEKTGQLPFTYPRAVGVPKKNPLR